MTDHEIFNLAKNAAKAHSDKIDEQMAFQVGFLKAHITMMCDILDNTRSELKRVQQELNSIGEL